MGPFWSGASDSAIPPTLQEMDSSLTGGLSPVQKAEMMACIHNAIEDLRMEVVQPKNIPKKTLKAQLPQKSTLQPTAPPFVAQSAPTPEAAPIPDVAKSNNWETSEVGYFLPDSTREKHVRMSEGCLYFSNVLAFTVHIRALTVFKNESIICLNLCSCLRGEALQWFTSELSQHEREKLRNSSLDEGWLRSLTNRFKTRPSHALKILKKSKYNWEDVRSQRSIVIWAHNMLRVAKESDEFPKEWQQLHAVWNQIELPIRGHVNEPTSETKIASFMEELDQWYHAWR